MKLAAVSIVRDEADILESWIRHNLFFVDRIYISDDGSTDETSKIIELLRQEGLPLSVVNQGIRGAYRQGERTTTLLAHAVRDEKWDFLFPLDGDEFLIAESRSVLEADLQGLGEHGVGGLNPRHYLMTEHDDTDEPDPLARLQRVAVHDPYVFKVVVPAARVLDDGFSIIDGNHRTARWDVLQPAELLPRVVLAHFPARSEAQLVSKGLSGYMRWMARTDFPGGAPDRVLKGASILKDEGEIKVRALPSLATTLGVGFASEEARLHPFRERQGEVRYPELATSYPYRRILSAADDLIRGFKQAQLENEKLRRQATGLPARLRAVGQKHWRSIMRRITALRSRG